MILGDDDDDDGDDDDEEDEGDFSGRDLFFGFFARVETPCVHGAHVIFG